MASVDVGIGATTDQFCVGDRTAIVGGETVAPPGVPDIEETTDG
ncbi:MAG: hypothetical protein ABEJ85_05725 [Haloarculaceae archaeon]